MIDASNETMNPDRGTRIYFLEITSKDSDLKYTSQRHQDHQDKRIKATIVSRMAPIGDLDEIFDENSPRVTIARVAR